MRAGLVLVLAAWASLGGLAGEARGEQMRAVSLKVLQSRLKSAAGRERARPELLNLCGLTRVVGYALDEKRRDLILLGEAARGGRGLRTEDLAIALRSAWLRYATPRGNKLYYSSPGCSIDPDPSALRRLGEIGRAGSEGAPESADKETEAWEAICREPHRVSVLGVPADTHFAAVMVEADYLMKRLVNGSAGVSLPGLKSLMEMRVAAVEEELGKEGPGPQPEVLLNRFWFYPGETSFREDGGLMLIERCQVVLLTEQEYVSREGMAGRGGADPLAKEFAGRFTARYDEIGRALPIYSELEGLFRLYALATLLRHRQVKADLGYLLEQFPVRKTAVAAGLPGLPRVQRVEGRKEEAGRAEVTEVWVRSCGGVSMDFKIEAAKVKRAPGTKPGSKEKKAAVLKARPKSDSLYWEVGRP
jgi:hypothetical protein